MKITKLLGLLFLVCSAAKADGLDLTFEHGSSIVDQGKNYHVTVAAPNLGLWGPATPPSSPVKGYVFDIPKTECSGDACRSGGPIQTFEQHDVNQGRFVPATISYSVTSTAPQILSVTFQNPTSGLSQTVTDQALPPVQSK